jgi:hypothetical protein
MSQESAEGEGPAIERQVAIVNECHARSVAARLSTLNPKNKKEVLAFDRWKLGEAKRTDKLILTLRSTGSGGGDHKKRKYTIKTQLQREFSQAAGKYPADYDPFLYLGAALLSEGHKSAAEALRRAVTDVSPDQGWLTPLSGLQGGSARHSSHVTDKGDTFRITGLPGGAYQVYQAKKNYGEKRIWFLPVVPL